MIVIIMGVSGAGKTTIGTLLAARLGWIYSDADDYFEPAQKLQMAEGRPLIDEDRWPWLARLNGLLRHWSEAKIDGVLACSALKQSYHLALEQGLDLGNLVFVFLDLPKELIAGRLAHRHHEYMNASLLDSQFATLERPRDALRIVNDRPPEEIVDRIVAHLLPRPDVTVQQFADEKIAEETHERGL